MEEGFKLAKKYQDFLMMKRYIDPKYASYLSFGLLLISSKRLWNCFKIKEKQNLFSHTIKKSMVIKLKNERNLENKLVFVQGNIIKSNQELIKDPLFNMTSSNIDDLGLYRKVEILEFNTNRKEIEQWFNINEQLKKYNFLQKIQQIFKFKINRKENEEWFNINEQRKKNDFLQKIQQTFEFMTNRKEIEQWFNNINGQIKKYHFHKKIQLRSQVATNGTLTVEDHQLSKALLIQLANQNSLKKGLDKQMIQEFFSELEVYSRNSSSQSSESIFGDLSTHPLLELAKEGKHFSLKDDYIYIQTSSDKINNGDIRISFHDVNKIAEVTLLAAKNGNFLQEFERKGEDNYDVGVEVNGKTLSINLSAFSFVTNGRMKKEEIIKYLSTHAFPSVNKKILILSLIIFSIYFYIEAYLIFPYCPNGPQVSQEVIAKIVVQHQTEISNATAGKESLIEVLSNSLICSGINIWLSKTLAKSFVLSSAWALLFIVLYSKAERVSKDNYLYNLRQKVLEQINLITKEEEQIIVPAVEKIWDLRQDQNCSNYRYRCEYSKYIYYLLLP